MRTAKLSLIGAALVIAFAGAPAFAFDGTKATDHRTPMEAFVLPDETKIAGAVREVLGTASAVA